MGKRRPSGDGLVRKRKDGRWEGRIVVGHKQDGKPIYRSVFADKQTTLMPKLADLKEQYCGIEITEDSSITLSEWLEKWLKDYKEPILRPSTIIGYRSEIENHIIPYLGDKRITQIKTSDIQKLYNRLVMSGRKEKSKGEGLSSTSVRRIHLLLHQSLDCAVRDCLIPKNPTDGASPPKIERTEKRVLCKEELEKLIQEIKGDEMWYEFFYTAIMTGMREGEICGLRWEDFDDKTGILRVVRTVSYRQGGLSVGEPKTDDGKRTIYLPNSVWHILSKRKEIAYSEWIFPSLRYPNLAMNPTTAYQQLKKYLKKAGLPSIRFHDLRHTFTSHAANTGIEPKTLSEIVGHSKASFTLDTYAHVTTEMQKSASNIMTNYITDILGKELKPWQKGRKTEKDP